MSITAKIEAHFGFKKVPFQKDIGSEDLFVTPALKQLRSRLDHMKQNSLHEAKSNLRISDCHVC